MQPFRLTILAIVASGLAPVDAIAQERVAALSAPDVVVTANRFAQDSKRLPVGLQVITPEDIRASGAQTLPEVLALQAGVTVRDAFGSPNRQIDLRGFGATGDQNTLILLNGQRISENELVPADLAAISLGSVERIEIQRGSGAVLYGSGATGGTINVITRGPAAGDRSADVRATAGNYGTFGAGAGFSVGSDQLGASFQISRLDSDNYRRNNDLRQENVNGELAWFGDRGPVTLKFSAGDQDLRLPGPRTEQQLQTDRRGTSEPDNYASLQSSRVVLGTTQSFGFGDFSIDVGHRERRSRAYYANFGGGFNSSNGRVNSISPRLRFPFSFGAMNNTLIVGADWDSWDYNSDNTFSNSQNRYELENAAGYLQNTLELPWRTVATFGGRWQRVRTDFQRGPTAFDSGTEQNDRDNLKAGELALRQPLTVGLALYGRIGTSFRVPAAEENLFAPGLLKPQTSRDREVGFDWTDSNRRLRVSFYQSKLDNEILYLSSILIPPAGQNINLPPTRRQGVELDGAMSFGQAWSISANYTYAEAEFREGAFNALHRSL
ncbi:MAG: TonB-dependent receptor [Burkholderiales bacterium]|nr:TonB-dependent receptor [Burkholderiales bacterium]